MRLQLINQTDAMVMEKNSPGLKSTFTNAAVRAKSSSMASRLPRIRTGSGMLVRKGEGHQVARQGKMGTGAGQWSHEVGAGREAGGVCSWPLTVSTRRLHADLTTDTGRS